MPRKKDKQPKIQQIMQSKRNKRRVLTFIRMCRYGINNFSRNIWLTVAATAVMTITLLIIFTTFAARSILQDSIGVLSEKVDMSIYLKSDASKEKVDKVIQDLNSLSNVSSVNYISPEQAEKNFIESNKESSSTLDAVNEARETGTPTFPATLRINLKDIQDTTQLTAFVDENTTLKEIIHPDRKPSFSSDRRAAIESIGRTVGFAEKAGLLASVVFVAISSLIVFNTIRMAIFNRKEEIQMMKLIGADPSFIRGPFIVEAVVYGFIAAVIATGIGTVLLVMSQDKLKAYGVAVDDTIRTVVYYSPFVLIAMVLLGAIIGVISSYLATRKHLKLR